MKAKLVVLPRQKPPRDWHMLTFRMASFMTGAALAIGFAQWIGLIDVRKERGHPIERAPPPARTEPKAIAHPVPLEPVREDPVPFEELKRVQSPPPQKRVARSKGRAAAGPVDRSAGERIRLQALFDAFVGSPIEARKRAAFEDALRRAASALPDSGSIAIDHCIDEGHLTPNIEQTISTLERCLKQFEEGLSP